MYVHTMAASSASSSSSSSSSLLLLLLLSWVFMLSRLPAALSTTEPSATYCNTNTNFTSQNSQISANIAALLPKLVQATEQNAFIATSYTKFPGSQLLYGLSQCRGDVSSADCSSCIQQAAKQIRITCPNQADARIWYEYCFLRYDTKDFIGEVDTGYGIIYYNVQNVSDPDATSFNNKLGELVDRIESQAVQPQNKGLGKGKVKLSPFSTLYALVQCTRDLSPINCAQCLAIAVANYATICGNKQGCRVIYSSCYVRYELYPFYFPLDAASSSSSSFSSKAYHNYVVFRPLLN